MKKIIEYIKNFKSKFNLLKALFASSFLTIIFCFLQSISLEKIFLNYKFLLMPVVTILVFLMYRLIKYMIISIISRSITYFDYLIFIFKISSLELVVIHYPQLSLNSTNNFYLWLMVFIIICFIYVIRLIFYRVPPKKYSLTLIDVVDNTENFLNNPNSMLIDSPVSYDLLGRDNIKDEICDRIISTRQSEKFVIAIKGKWGIGKTTLIHSIIQTISQNKNFIIIDDKDFDIWKYSDELSLFTGMLETIIKKVKITVNPLIIKDAINKYINMFDSPKIKVTASIFTDNSTEERLTQIIDEYLLKYDKRILFVIDNIDRTENKNILFLYKIIASILQFKNITYLLSFDERRIKDVLDTYNFSYNFLDKIIQTSYLIESPDHKNINNIISKCFENKMRALNIDDEEIENVLSKMHLISNHIDNIRDLIIFLNNTSYIFNKKYFYLDTKDALLIEFLKKFNFDLYCTIRDNPRYFVKYGRKIDSLIFRFNYNLENEIKDFFKNLLEKYKYYINIIFELFPHTESYNKTNGIFYDDENEKENSFLNKRIFNAIYFNSYFIGNTNEYINIYENVAKIINLLNTTSMDENKIINYLEDISLNQYYIENIYYQLGKLNVDKMYFLLKHLFINFSKIYNDDHFFETHRTKYTCTLLMAEICRKLTLDQLLLFCEEVKDEYQSLEALRFINYLIKKKDYDNSFSEVYEEINNTFLKMKEEIIMKNIDLYSKQYYSVRNASSIILDNDQNSIEYIRRVINEFNVLLFLRDLIQEGMSSDGYFYRIDIALLGNIFNLSILESLFPKTFRNEDEERIVKIYYYSKEHIENNPLSEDYSENGKRFTFENLIIPN